MQLPPSRPRNQPWISEEEWEQRLQLAACYRLFGALGWNDGLFNQISLRLAGGNGGVDEFLVNPVGLSFEDVTATRLVKVDGSGSIVAPTRYQVDAEGFAPYARVHALRQDVYCVMHVQTAVSVAVSCKAGALRADNFYSAQLFGRLGQVDFAHWQNPHLSGFVQDIGIMDALILRQRGLLTLSFDVANAYWLMWTLHRACEVQALTDSMAGDSLPMESDVAARFAGRAPIQQSDIAELAFAAAMRRHGIDWADLAG